MTFKTWWTHLKIWAIGDKELEKNGKVIPCKKCNKPFKSYTHQSSSGFTYDSKCNDCEGVEYYNKL